MTKNNLKVVKPTKDKDSESKRPIKKSNCTWLSSYARINRTRQIGRN